MAARSIRFHVVLALALAACSPKGTPAPDRRIDTEPTLPDGGGAGDGGADDAADAGDDVPPPIP